MVEDMTKNNSNDCKVLVIGLDGATLDLIKPWCDQGELPTFSRLMKSGAWGELSAQLPPNSVPNWPSFATGKNPGKHGVIWWTKETNNRIELVNSRSIKGKTTWEILSDRGKRVAVVGVPVTYPPQKINGVMVTGLLTPPSVDDFTYQLELKAELDKQVGGYRILNKAIFRRGGEEAFLKDWLDVFERQINACIYLLQTRSWDLFTVVFSITDMVQHKFWNYMDPEHPAYKPEEAKLFGDAILRVYRAADKAVDALMNQTGEETHVIIMSDHGFGTYYQAFFTNNWLMKQGFLNIRRNFSSAVRYSLYRMGITVNNIYPFVNTGLSLLRGNKLREQISPKGKSRGLLFKFFLSENDIDWTRTKAYAVGDFGQFYVNLRGKFPHGIVEPGKEYEDVRDEILRRLETLKIPATGKPYLKRGYKKEELYHGPELEQLPDIICEPTDMRYVDTGMGFMSNKLFDNVSIISGNHNLKGILFLQGKDVQESAQINGANIIDIAPTILYLLGEPVPDDMDGRVLEQCLKKERLILQPVQIEESQISTTREAERILSREEEELIKDRLRDLGYIS